MTSVKETVEIFDENDSITVAAYLWGNPEGLDLVVNSKIDEIGNIATRFSGSLSWDEIDVLIRVLQKARDL